MSQNTNTIASRVAKFSISKGIATFRGLVPHDEATKAKGVVYMTQRAANALVDRHARNTSQTRAAELAIGMTVNAALLDGVTKATFSTGAGVESLRQSHNARAKADRDDAKLLRGIRKAAGF